MRKWIVILLTVLLAAPVVMAVSGPDDDDKALGIQRGIRHLHPDRERAKAMKKLQEQMSRKADPNADPWDTSGELWGAVDVPPQVVLKDSTAVEGHRLPPRHQHTSKTPEEQAALDSLLAGDYSYKEYGYRRMTWRDLPVTTTIDQLMPGFTVDENGDCFSKYVSRDKMSNEVYFAFTMHEDSLPGPLRMCVQYCADDPLDFDQIIFLIDGFDYQFYPSGTQRGTLPGELYWESSDDVLHAAYKDLVYALAHSNWVAIKMISTRGIHHVKMLTDGQRADFAHTLDLYRLLGGVIQ